MCHAHHVPFFFLSARQKGPTDRGAAILLWYHVFHLAFFVLKIGDLFRSAGLDVPGICISLLYKGYFFLIFSKFWIAFSILGMGYLRFFAGFYINYKNITVLSIDFFDRSVLKVA